MKTQVCRSWLGRLTALIVLTPLAAWAAEASASQADGQKKIPSSHVLFTGTDIQIDHLGKLYRVQGVEDGSLVIRVNDENVKIPLGTKLEKIKASQALLLANRSANVTNYKYDRAYTPANDPVRKWSTALAAVGDMHDAVAHKESVLASTPQTKTVSDNSVVTPMGFGTKQIENPQYAKAEAGALNAQSRISGNMGDTSTYAEKIAQELAMKLFDAVDVEFEVSAAKPIRNPYLVATMKYREKDDAKNVKSAMLTKALPPIGAEPQKVALREAGFPLGFEIESLQVHLYENGVEIATNLSENRAELTRDEAHEFLVIEYLSTHKTDTKQPQIAVLDLPDDWAARRNDESLQKTYYVKVDKAGRADGVFEDENCTTKASDSYCATVLNNLLFVPAVKTGEPVDGVLRINPARLAL